MKTNILTAALVIGSLITIGWSIASLLVTGRQLAPEAEQPVANVRRAADRDQTSSQPSPAAPSIPEATPLSSPPEGNTVSDNLSNKPVVKAGGQANVGPQKQTPQVSQAPQPKEPLQDPLARVALSFVGADLDAELYWLEAINNANLSAHEREDLIEDLNEEGFSDPRRPTVDELPLIVSRLLLIEELAPNAMDEVNAAAFAEAYKDLVNMYARLTQP